MSSPMRRSRRCSTASMTGHSSRVSRGASAMPWLACAAERGKMAEHLRKGTSNAVAGLQNRAWKRGGTSRKGRAPQEPHSVRTCKRVSCAGGHVLNGMVHSDPCFGRSCSGAVEIFTWRASACARINKTQRTVAPKPAGTEKGVSACRFSSSVALQDRFSSVGMTLQPLNRPCVCDLASRPQAQGGLGPETRQISCGDSLEAQHSTQLTSLSPAAPTP